MPLPKHTVLIHNTYYARLDVPKDVIPYFNKKVLKKSLQTSSLKVAKDRSSEIVGGWKREIHAYRGVNNHKTWEAEVFALRKGLGSSIDRHPGDIWDDEHLERLREKYDDYSGEFVYRTTQAFLGGNFDRIFVNEFISDFEPWLRKSGSSEKTAAEAVSALKEVAAWFGDSSPNHGSVSKLIEEMEGKGKARTTIHRRLEAGKNYYKYLAAIGYIGKGKTTPFHDHKLTRQSHKERSNSSYQPWTPEQVAQLYNAAKGREDTLLCQSIQFAAYTGFRIEEIFSIKPAAIKNNCFTLSDSKTLAGIREVPIHPVLQPLVESLTSSSKDGYLFPSTSKNKYGKRSDAVGKRFGRLKTSLGFEGRRLVFHSFRKTVSTSLEQSGVPEAIAADILGHEKKTMTYGLYSGGSSYQQKYDAIIQLKYSWD